MILKIQKMYDTKILLYYSFITLRYVTVILEFTLYLIACNEIIGKFNFI